MAKRYFIPNEVSTYLVCPEAWRLQYLVGEEAKDSVVKEESIKQREDWKKSTSEFNDLFMSLKVIIFIGIFLVVAVIFVDNLSGIPGLNNSRLAQGYQLSSDGKTEVLSEVLLLLVLLGILVFVWEKINKRRKDLLSNVGLGQKILEVKESDKFYYDSDLSLRSRPDAVLRDEQGFLIPILRRPNGKKVKDRHVAEIIFHLICIEKAEGQPSPYGIIILGKESRQVQIVFSEERKSWIKSIIAEMSGIIEGKKAVPSPGKYKCINCEVKEACHFKFAEN